MNVNVNRCVHDHDEEDDGVARDPGQRESIPKSANGKIAHGGLRGVGRFTVDESQGRQQSSKYEPSYVNIVSVAEKAAFANSSHSWSENVKSTVNGNSKHGKICTS